MSIESVLKNMSHLSTRDVFYVCITDAMDECEKEKEIIISEMMNHAQQLEEYSLTDLFLAYKRLVPNINTSMRNLNKQALIQLILEYHINMISFSMKEKEAKNIVMKIDKDNFYAILQDIIDNKDKMSVDENLEKMGIEYLLSDHPLIGHPVG